jgi:hypothetical protein
MRFLPCQVWIWHSSLHLAKRRKSRAGPTFNFPVLASSALSAKTVVCVGLNALCAALEPVPNIQFVKDATVTLEDLTPQPLVSGASATAPNTRSLWQTDSAAVKFELGIDWALRDSRACAWISGVNW